MESVLFVKAIKTGFYRGQRRRPGIVFQLEAGKDFRPSWMEPAKANQVPQTPEAIRQAAREHKLAMRGKKQRLQPNAVDPVPESVDPTDIAGEKATGDQSVI